MEWVSRKDVRIGRIACTWLIERFIEPSSTVAFVSSEEIDQHVNAGAIPFHVVGCEFDHRDGQTPFEAMLEKYGLVDANPALGLMGRIVNGADTDNLRYHQPEGPGLRAVSEGFRRQHQGDWEIIEAMRPVLDATYAYCQGVTEG